MAKQGSYQSRPRPVPGTVFTQEVRYQICGTCGFIIDAGLCSSECPQDDDAHPDMFEAVYERTDRFIRDEPTSNLPLEGEK